MATELKKKRCHLCEKELRSVMAQCVRKSESILYHFLMLTSPQTLLLPFHIACFLVSSCFREYGYFLTSAFFSSFIFLPHGGRITVPNAICTTKVSFSSALYTYVVHEAPFYTCFRLQDAFRRDFLPLK